MARKGGGRRGHLTKHIQRETKVLWKMELFFWTHRFYKCRLPFNCTVLKVVIEELAVVLYQLLQKSKTLLVTLCVSITSLLVKIPARVLGTLMRDSWEVMLLASLLSHIHLFIHILCHSLEKQLLKFMLGMKETDKRHGSCCQEVACLTDGISQYPMLLLAMQTLDS